MIKQAGDSGGGHSIALWLAEASDSPIRGELGRVIFGSGGLRSRGPPICTYTVNTTLQVRGIYYTYIIID